MLPSAAAERLKRALASLAQGTDGGARRELTISALCELAEVSRNSLYRYHADVLREFRALKQRRGDPASSARVLETLRAQQAELATLRLQVPKLVALVDHYYQAYQEAQALLARREQELSELRRHLDHRPIELKR